MTASPIEPDQRDLTRGGATAHEPQLVSRSNAGMRTSLLASDGGELPRFTATHVRWIFVIAIALQAFAWWRVDGFQLADSVEYMERARTFVRGEQMIDAGAIRPFGFSFLLVPFFAFAEWFGITDERAIVWCVVVLQMFLGCILAWRCMRIGAIVAGRTGAIVAGFLVATNPVLLQYSTQPVSDIAAGVCVAYALELLLVRDTFRRSLVIGLWLGVAFMIAYKTLLVSLVIILVVFVRDRWKHSATWRGIGAGLVFGILVQSTLDYVMYRSFGASVINYVGQNANGLATKFFYNTFVVTKSLGIPWQWAWDTALALYRMSDQDIGAAQLSQTGDASGGSESSLYYLIQMPTMIVWPAIVLFALACVRVALRPNWKTSVIAGTFGVCFVVMSYKGTKDYRLMVSLLPLVAPLLAYGWEWTASGFMARFDATRSFTATIGALAVVGCSLQMLTRTNVRHFGGYWAAIEWVNERAQATFEERRARSPWLGRDREPEPLRVGSAYNWAVFLRQSPLVKVVKLPWQLNLWKKYEKQDDHGLREKSDDFAALEELDVLIVHLPILSQNKDLMTWIDAHYEIAGALYDQRTYEDIGPIFVLERRTGSKSARTFFDITRDADPAQFARSRQIEHTTDFIDRSGTDRLELLGVEYGNVPPMNFGWVTYHWRAPAGISRDYWVLDRVTSPDEHDVWENNHPLAYGNLPAETWRAGDILSESYLMVPAHQAYKSDGKVRPIGGAYRRGDLIPTRTWMKLRAFEPTSLIPPAVPIVTAELAPARAGEPDPIRAPEHHGVFETADGIQFSADDFVRVSAFFVPVLRPWRLPDDGRPLPD